MATNKLEELPAELQQAVESEKVLTTEKVLSISQELDEVILNTMRRVNGHTSRPKSAGNRCISSQAVIGCPVFRESFVRASNRMASGSYGKSSACEFLLNAAKLRLDV